MHSEPAMPLPPQEQVETNWPAPRAAYVHVPFCAHRCGYCNFTVLAGRDDLIARYLDAVTLELRSLAGPHPVETIFIGGGTPTHLPPGDLERLLAAIAAAFPLAAGGEFSVEANPAGLTSEKLKLLADHGVNRLSLGAQSFSTAKLKLLERDHSADEIRAAVELARTYLRSVAVDLIFGVPGETLEDWQRDLAQVLQLRPNHISTYGLTFERGTHFWSRRLHGDLAQLDEELEREMYLMALARLPAEGFEHYEVSNFAQPGFRCRHNETYWAGLSYWAVGPGAARYVRGRREVNHQSTTTYLRRVLAGESPTAFAETLAAEDRARELLVLGLRRMEGVSRDEFVTRTGYAVEQLVGPQLGRHVAVGLLADDGRRIRLTRSGLLVSDAIWPDFLRV